MKGRDTFTSAEIKKIKELIVLRNKTPSSGQKTIRQKMRDIGFYGKDDWGITDLQVADLDSLIKAGRINDDDSNLNQSFPASINALSTSKPKDKSFITTEIKDIASILLDFESNFFDPQIDKESKVSNMSGNYILCLRKHSKLPNVAITPIYTKFLDLDVVYTGIASISLRTRDYRQHFKGNNAGRSTLRKSLGVLFGYTQIPRDKDLNNGKTKFNELNEQRLSEWMHLNLVMFTFPTANFADIELKLINHFNPPLNLKNNKNHINSDFRRLLSNLRNA